MAETLSPEQARARFRAVARGRYVDHGLDVEEAKARLRESDPGVDIAPLLGAMEHGDYRMAFAGLVPWLWSSEARRFLQPVFERGLLLAFRGLGMAHGIIRHARGAQRPPRAVGGSRAPDAGPRSTS
jgi:hypothetical protein